MNRADNLASYTEQMSSQLYRQPYVSGGNSNNNNNYDLYNLPPNLTNNLYISNSNTEANQSVNVNIN